MKFPNASVLALAICLAGCATASADTADTQTASTTDTAAEQAGQAVDTAAAPTVDEARAFVAQVEKELGEFGVVNARAQWVNATYITDDTDALAAYFGTIGTEMQVKYANQA